MYVALFYINSNKNIVHQNIIKINSTMNPNTIIFSYLFRFLIEKCICHIWLFDELNSEYFIK